MAIAVLVAVIAAIACPFVVIPQGSAVPFVLVSTAVAQSHRATQWRDPRIALLPGAPFMRSQRTPSSEGITITLQLERLKELPSGKVTPDGGPKSYRLLPISEPE
jgi:hypothetical protein